MVMFTARQSSDVMVCSEVPRKLPHVS
jgi:hypothetical protein